MNRARRIGILGAGQLALMLAEAARGLDVEIVCAGQPGDCAEQVAPVVPINLGSVSEVHAFADTVDLVTIESENIDAAVLEGLNLQPNVRAVGIAQDRLPEKNFFQDCGIRVAPFEPVEGADELRSALANVGLPAILKTRRMGYDGKGQVRITAVDQSEAAWEAIGKVPCIIEGMLQFDGEVSLVAARSTTGQTCFYPLTHNFHRDGILRKSIAPFRNGALQELAQRYLTKMLEPLEYVGVLAVEFFVQGETLVANEMAPRVHNSGHWTIEGSDTSQFANHLRAMLGMPLGSTASRPTVMLNCIGCMPSEEETRSFPEIWRHDYRKEPREGRKVGHLTFPATAVQAIEEWQKRLDRGC